MGHQQDIKQTSSWDSNNSGVVWDVIRWGKLFKAGSRTKSLQSCLTLCESMDHSLPGSYVHGILQARIQEWVARLSSRASSWLRDWTCVTWIVGGFFTHWATWKAPSWYMLLQFNTTPFRCHDELQSIFCCIQTLPSEPGIMLQLWNMWISLLICASLTLRAPFWRT